MLFHFTETVRGGTLMCSRPFMVTKNDEDKRGSIRFSVELVLTHSTETFLGPTFGVSEKLWYGILWIKSGIITIFPRVFFSHSKETLRKRNPYVL